VFRGAGSPAPLPLRAPISCSTDSGRRAVALKRKDNSPQTPEQPNPTSLVLPHNIHSPVQEFQPDTLSRTVALRTDSPVHKHRSHGTLLHFSLQNSHLNICYYHQDLHQGRVHAGSRQALPTTPPRPPTLFARNNRRKGPASVARFSAIHFQGYFIRQVSCYTLLSGFRLPWPPSCCLNEPTPFLGST